MLALDAKHMMNGGERESIEIIKELIARGADAK
jgi:hypothetical protein